MAKIPLTEAERKMPYADFYDRPSATLPKAVLDRINNNTYQPKDALRFENLNDLLLPGYLPMETGFCRMPNGSFFVAVRTEFTNATSEMINWWFDWHAKEPLRYRIWYPEAHFGISMKDKESHQHTPDALPYWHTTHYPIEDVGLGSETIAIHFLPPAEFGFDSARFDEANIETVICAKVGSVTKNVAQHTKMCHVVRRYEGGLEMRSRFWLGDEVRLPPFFGSKLAEKVANTRLMRHLLLPAKTGYVMAMHCAQEYNNLAQILPELYHAYS